jgi:hypothetical protein
LTCPTCSLLDFFLFPQSYLHEKKAREKTTNHLLNQARVGIAVLIIYETKEVSPSSGTRSRRPKNEDEFSLPNQQLEKRVHP